MKTKKHFPNGFEGWMETHHEVVDYLTRMSDIDGSMSDQARERGGIGALYELGEELTDEFEAENEGRAWDGEFYDEVEVFLRKKEEVFL